MTSQNTQISPSSRDSLTKWLITISFAVITTITCQGTHTATVTVTDDDEASSSQDVKTNEATFQNSSIPEGFTVASSAWHTLQIRSDGSAILEMASEASAIKHLRLRTQDTTGEIQIHTVSLNGSPLQFHEPPATAIYEYIQIGHETFQSHKIDSAVIRFGVRKHWIETTGYSSERITLNRYMNGWKYLPTRIIGQNDSNILFETISPGLGLLAITLSDKVVEQQSRRDNHAVLPSTEEATAIPFTRPTQTATNISQVHSTPELQVSHIPTTALRIVVTATPSRKATVTPDPTMHLTHTPSPIFTSVTPVKPSKKLEAATAPISPSLSPTPTYTPAAIMTPPIPTPSYTVPTLQPTATQIPKPTLSPTQAPVPPSVSYSVNTPVQKTATPMTTATPSPTYTPTSSPTPTYTPTQTATPTSTPTPTSTATPVPLQGDDRFGIATHTMPGSDTRYFLEKLGVKWYLDFKPDMSQVPEGGAQKIPYMPFPSSSGAWISGKAESIEYLSDAEISDLGFMPRHEIKDLARAAPGSYWYIIGEVNRFEYITAPRYASVFKYYYTQLKLADPTSLIIGPSILNWDYTCVGCGGMFYCENVGLPGYQCGKVWLNEFISSYQNKYGIIPPVDVWAIDTYPLDWLNIPNTSQHAQIVIDQLTGMRSFLDGFPEYSDTPIWITEIAVHVGYDDWSWDFSTGNVVPIGDYYWENMSDYLTSLLDWLELRAASHQIEKWFFFTTWRDMEKGSPDGYMGLIFFDGPEPGASINCLGNIYRSRSLPELYDTRVKCDSVGNTVQY